jgi:hypothetical protein
MTTHGISSRPEGPAAIGPGISGHRNPVGG